jgi:pyruvate kinase
MERLTKIVATLGPAVANPDSIRALVAAGMDVARLNFSHGDHELHAQLAGWVRAAARDEERVVALLQDIQGPKLRVGSFPDGSVIIPTGTVVALVPGRQFSEDPTRIFVDYDHLLADLKPGERILLADGLIHLVAESVEGDHVIAKVVQGGGLGDGKGVAFPDTDLRVPAITDKDRLDLEFGKSIKVDYVAASFVRSGADVREIRELAGGHPSSPRSNWRSRIRISTTSSLSPPGPWLLGETSGSNSPSSGSRSSRPTSLHAPTRPDSCPSPRPRCSSR